MKKIIIVEDTDYLQIRLEKLLSKNNIFDIQTVKSNALTSKYLNKVYSDAGLFILDLDNYNKNAIEYIKRIHDIDALKPAPIIALSKNANIPMLKRAVASGCSDFVLKPFEDLSLIYKVKKILDIKQSDENSPNKYIPSSAPDHEIKLQWSDDFKINVDEVDAEHKSLFDQFETLYNLMKAGSGHDYYKELLAFLNKYVHTHFINEQKLHLDNQYPLREEHINIHEEFKASVLKICEEGKDKTPTDMDLIKISLFIKNWLIHHILIEDRKFGDYIENK